MDCEKISLLLADYSTENLSAASRRAVEAHLQECSGCRRHLAQLGAVGNLVEGLEPQEPPAEIWTEITARGQRFFGAPAARVYSPVALRWAFVSAVFALLVFALSVFFSMRYFSPHPPEVIYASPLQASLAAGSPRVDMQIGDYLQQHAATSSQDALSDPISVGLVSYTTAAPPAGAEP